MNRSDLCELLSAVFDECEKRENASTLPIVELHCSGEFDSRQSNFERKSNALEIGVLAKDQTVARALLSFTRMIVDEHDWGYIASILETDVLPTAEVLLTRLAETERDYHISFPLHQAVFTSTLYGHDGEIEVRKHLGQMDLWTLPRIRNGFTETNESFFDW